MDELASAASLGMTGVGRSTSRAGLDAWRNFVSTGFEPV